MRGRMHLVSHVMDKDCEAWCGRWQPPARQTAHWREATCRLCLEALMDRWRDLEKCADEGWQGYEHRTFAEYADEVATPKGTPGH